MSVVTWALECKAPWAEAILNGSKSIEVRSYSLPSELAGQKCWLVASTGQEGVATFGDTVQAGAEGGCLMGWVLFDGVTQYESAEQFAADHAAHCVPPDSPYAFVPGSQAPLFGWRVLASHALPKPLPLPALRRFVRSVYRLAQ